MLVRLSHIMLYSKRHAESVKWYCEKLGYEIEYNAPGEYASLHHKGLGRLAIHATSDASQIGKGPMPYFLCNRGGPGEVTLRPICRCSAELIT